MTNPHPKCRTTRFQFGLRKLLLWTVVAALYLGIVNWLGLGVLFAVLLAVLVCLIGVSRSVQKNPSNLRWWHLRPWSPIVVGAFVGGVVAYVVTWPLVSTVEPPYWIAVAIESSDGLLPDPAGVTFLGVLGGVIVGLLVELLFPPEG